MSTQHEDIISTGFAKLDRERSNLSATPGGSASAFNATPPLFQPTGEALQQAFATNLFDLFRAMSHLPGGEIEQQPTLCRHHAYPFNPMFKGVWHTRLTETDLAAAIEDTIAWFKQRNAPFFFWWVDPQATPLTLDAQLQAHGLAAWEVAAPGMAAELAQLRYELMARVPANFTMERVHDEKGLRAFKEAFVRGFEVPEWAGQAWVDATMAFGIEQAPWQVYVGWLNGEPVAANMLFNGAGVAAVFGVATAPEARGQGIGAAITLLAYQDALHAGYQHGVLFATDLGAPVYRRLGFQDVGVGMSRYLWRQ